MKGVIMKIGAQKSVVLFTNGKFGSIPTPDNGQVGMVIHIAYNRKKIAFAAALAALVLAAVGIGAYHFYYTSAGYVYLDYGSGAAGNGSLELAYNRFGRVLAARPLSVEAVDAAAARSLRNRKLPEAYQATLRALSRSIGPGAALRVRIAQEDLGRAKDLKRSLSLLTFQEHQDKRTVFEAYTIERYQKAMQETLPTPQSPPGHHRGTGRGRRRSGIGRGRWCW
ncbi:MAG: hypothetical protein LBD74_08090 [Spirochaetaceae bacterium]|jgi:hypothetical protein|nr:hypothetical protein [Spirochaetaceae bacterium]